MSQVTLEHSGEVLVNVHDESICEGRFVCAIHNPSNHHMRNLPQHWRSDRRILERVCSHGVGHPDPDDPKFADPVERSHGCDGCCNPPFSDLGGTT